MPLQNLYKCKQVVYCYLCILFTLSLQCCCCMFTCLSPFFLILMFLLYFCLFVDHVNKSIVLFLYINIYINISIYFKYRMLNANFSYIRCCIRVTLPSMAGIASYKRCDFIFIGNKLGTAKIISYFKTILM